MHKRAFAVLIVLGANCAWGNDSQPVSIESGSVSFEATTNVPGIEIKGTSSSLAGIANVSHESGSLLVNQIHVSLPVKSLATGMKVRDEHMRKYIFTTESGQTPDVEFTAEQVSCPAAGSGEFACQVNGALTIRGVAHAFQTKLNVKEQGTAFRGSGDGVVKLSDYGIKQPTQFGVSAGNEVKVRMTLAGHVAAAAGATTGGER